MSICVGLELTLTKFALSSYQTTFVILDLDEILRWQHGGL
jgi:hypothetical protein